jgi:hypothetical protein
VETSELTDREKTQITIIRTYWGARWRRQEAQGGKKLS